MDNLSNHKATIESLPLVQKLILGVCFCTTLLLLTWVLYYCQYGIDFTDESFYIVWASNPFSYSASSTQFGFIYYPIFKLLGNDIVLFRQFNIILTFCLAWILTYLSLASLFSNQITSVAFKIVIASTLATTSILFIQLGLRTPSYNSLNLQGLIITVIGLLLFEKRLAKSSVLGAVLIGLGGWLTFMAKPPTAMMLGILVCIYFFIAKKVHMKLISVSILTAMLLVMLSAVLIDGSIYDFVIRIQTNLSFSQAMSNSYSIFELLRIDTIDLNDRQLLKLFVEMLGISLVVLAVMYAPQFKFFAKRINVLLCLLILVLVALHMAILVTGTSPHFSVQRSAYILSIPITSIFVGIMLSKSRVFFELNRSHWGLIFILLLLPHAYAFGTNTNYWETGGSAGMFWVLGGLVFLTTIKATDQFKYCLLTISMFAQLITMANIQSSFEFPYRQPQALEQNKETFNFGYSELILPKTFSGYLSSFINAANEQGFVSGTPVIDLSGRSPGLLYALGAHNTGAPWMIGGYPGSNQLAIARLNLVSCSELIDAWIVHEPNGPRPLSDDVLGHFGVNIKDYDIVGQFTTPVAGGFTESVQMLLKPIGNRLTKIDNCKRHRSDRSTIPSINAWQN
jgi:hypothetical protein